MINWKDIWLNEGFATYLSGLVVESFDGNSSFTSWKQQKLIILFYNLEMRYYISKMEAVSGQDLTEFFKDWLYNQGYPSYSMRMAST